MRVQEVTANTPSPHCTCLGTGSRSTGCSVELKASETTWPAVPHARGIPAVNRTSSESAVSFIRDPGSSIRDPSSQPGIPLPDGPVQRCLRAHFPEKCALDGFPEDLEEFGLIGHDHGEVTSELKFTNGDRSSLPLRTGTLLSEVRIGGRLLRRREDHRQLRERELILVACHVECEPTRLLVILAGLRHRQRHQRGMDHPTFPHGIRRDELLPITPWRAFFHA